MAPAALRLPAGPDVGRAFQRGKVGERIRAREAALALRAHDVVHAGPGLGRIEQQQGVTFAAVALGGEQRHGPER